jgi:hypothetical protein
MGKRIEVRECKHCKLCTGTKMDPGNKNGKDEPKTYSVVYITSTRKCSEAPVANNMHMTPNRHK